MYGAFRVLGLPAYRDGAFHSWPFTAPKFGAMATQVLASLTADVEQARACADDFSPAQADAARALGRALLAHFPERPAAAPPPGAAQAATAEPLTLLSLPPEMLVAVLQWLGPYELARVDCVARAFHPAPPASLVEQALRQRAAERGAVVPAALPVCEGDFKLPPGFVAAAQWTQLLSWRERRAAFPQRRV